MAEANYVKFLPGATINFSLTLRHPEEYLAGAGVVFRHEEEPTIELSASGVPGEPIRANPGGAALASGAPVLVSRTDMELRVPAQAPRGVYRANRMWVETHGGRLHRYEGDEMGEAARVAFEVVEEPEEKPILQHGFR